MSIVRQLSEETELARIQGTKMTTFFTKARTTVILTNKRVYQEMAEGAQRESKIIPLVNVDSFGLASSSKTWLLVIGIILALYGVYSFLTSYSKMGPFMVILLGAGFVAAWWYTRKIGAVVHSLSGKTEIFVEASAGNLQDISNFIAKIQDSILAANSTVAP